MRDNSNNFEDKYLYFPLAIHFICHDYLADVLSRSQEPNGRGDARPGIEMDRVDGLDVCRLDKLEYPGHML